MNDLQLAKYCLDCYSPREKCYLEYKPLDIDLYIKRLDNKEMVLCVQGSNSLRDWMVNFYFSPNENKRHSGWANSFRHLKPYLDNFLKWNEDIEKFHITGHSAGGALGQFILDYFIKKNKNSNGVIFGCPKIGRGFDIPVRAYENCWDPVIYFPPLRSSMDYEVIRFSKLNINPHSMETYLEFLENK